MSSVIDPRFELFGDHVLLDISLPENSGGLNVVERDPRKSDTKPDAYVGIVKEVGSRVSFVKPGDRIVVERWEYTQFDADEKHLIAREIDALVLADEKPAPNAVAIQIIDDVREKYAHMLTLPEAVNTEPERYYFGRVTASSCVDVKPGDFLFVSKMDHDQFRVAEHTLVCRLVSDEAFMKLVPAA